LSNEQFGFRSKFSTEMASYELINYILQTFNDKIPVGDIFRDLHKASDCVNYDVLLSKLILCGIVDTAHSLIKLYLSNRYWRVLIKDNLLYSHTCPNWVLSKNGVPQGSILGPLLFPFYINDLPTFLKNRFKPVLFADNMSILTNNPSLLNFRNEIINIFEQLNGLAVIY
jgi:hypothetical protein